MLTYADWKQCATDPHTVYRQWRNADDIVYDQESGSWLVTGHQQLLTVLRDTRFVSKPFTHALPTLPTVMQRLHALLEQQLLFWDGEEHRRAYRGVLEALTQRVRDPDTATSITACVKQLLDVVSASGELDVAAEFAALIAGKISAYLLGLSLREDTLRQMMHWSNAFADVTSGYVPNNATDILRMQHFFLSVIADRRESYARRDEQNGRVQYANVLDALLAGEVFPGDESLATNMQMLFAAGRVTGEKVLAEGIHMLLSEPGRWNSLYQLAHSHPRLPQLMAEELLRFVTPTSHIGRWASEQMTLTSRTGKRHQIARGEKLLLFLEAANRDPVVFPRPDDFDPWRLPNRHLAFGAGPHRCPGAALGRLELRLIFAELLRYPHLQHIPGVEPRYDPNPNVGGIRSYRIRIG